MSAPSRLTGDGFAESLPRRSRTILLGDDQFADLWEAVITDHFESTCDLWFIRFESEQHLRKLLQTGCADLVMLYLNNVKWSPTPPIPANRPSTGRKNIYYVEKIDILGALSARHRVPVLATQGLDLCAEGERAGIHFFPSPCRRAELMNAVGSALGIQPQRVALPEQEP